MVREADNNGDIQLVAVASWKGPGGSGLPLKHCDNGKRREKGTEVLDFVINIYDKLSFISA